MFAEDRVTRNQRGRAQRAAGRTSLGHQPSENEEAPLGEPWSQTLCPSEGEGPAPHSRWMFVGHSPPKSLGLGQVIFPSYPRIVTLGPREGKLKGQQSKSRRVYEDTKLTM